VHGHPQGTSKNQDGQPDMTYHGLHHSVLIQCSRSIQGELCGATFWPPQPATTADFGPLIHQHAPILLGQQDVPTLQVIIYASLSTTSCFLVGHHSR